MLHRTMKRRPSWLAPVAALATACGGSTAAPPPPPPTTPTGLCSTSWSRSAVFYEVFVRSFQDSNGDGVGDLPGLISRLDYLNDGRPETTEDLGVDALWLMPVFASPSYHGYDVVDYERIEPDYGTLADFERLIAEAHRRGMRVIVDFVMNHSGVGHPWFVESASAATSPKRNWYVWRPQNPAWTQPWDTFSRNPTWHSRNGAWYYGVFWSGMPDLNFQTPAVREEFKRLAKLWLERGVDGFRLDAVRYLIETGGGSGQADTAETHAFWKEFAAYVRQVKPDAVLVGEAWTTTDRIAGYYGSTQQVPGGDELPLNFNFPLAERIIQGVNGGDAVGIASKLADVRALYPGCATDAPFLTNHDHVRVATQLQGHVARQANAAAILLTLPGAAFLYYGEEVGLANGAGGGDEAKRTPMPWDTSAGGGFTTGTPWYAFASGRQTANVASQKDVPDSLLSRYRKLLRARKESVALREGSLRMLTPTLGNSATLAFVRSQGDEHVLVVHNLTDLAVSAGPLDAPGGQAEVLFSDRGVGSLTGGAGAWRVNLPARGTGIWRLR